MTEEKSTCPTCGSPVIIHQSDEGTGYMTPDLKRYDRKEVEIGESYKTIYGDLTGTVIRFRASVNCYEVEYDDGVTELVTPTGLAVYLDNINRTPYDLDLNNPVK